MKKITICVGTRPNFIKITQFDRFISEYPDLEMELVHTGQHFDQNMSEIFFDELKLRQPDVYLDAQGNSQIEMMTDIMVKFEDHLKASKPDLVLVPGDVNSSLACALVASRMGIPLGHIESGLRSFDRDMPEEINRILIDDLSDLYFVTEQSGLDHLKNEGKSDDKIHFVGNTMIDSLVAFTDQINASAIRDRLGVSGDYALLTFHRPSNVDQEETLTTLVNTISRVSDQIQLVFSVHPRTMKKLEAFGLKNKLEGKNIIITESLGYLDFMHLVKNARFVLTDSGGIQEETTFLGVPCLTVRENTERPITLTEGTNKLLSLKEEIILSEVDRVLAENNTNTPQIPNWDGNATGRILDVIQNYLK